MECIVVVLLVMLAWSQALAQYTHNITLIQILQPAPNTRTPLGVPTSIRAEFQNSGDSDQTNVRVVATISRQGTIVYRDTEYINNWMSGEYRDGTFRDFTPTTTLPYEICVYAELEDDENENDNSSCHEWDTRFETDIRAVNVPYPDDTTIREGTALRVRGRFSNIGVDDKFDVKARVQIKRCGNGILVFQADSTVPELWSDSTVAFTFPYKAGSFDTRNLGPGCYDVAVIALLSDDVDRTNDTAYNTFTITPLSNNIKAESILSPQAGSFKKPGDTIATSVRFKNTGTKSQVTVNLHFAAYDPTGTLVANEMVTSANWPSGEARTFNFKRFTTGKPGYYSIKAFATLPTDEKRVDDTLVITFFSGIRDDVRLVSISNPKPGDKKHVGKIGKLAITCKAETSPTSKSYNVPARATIASCFDQKIVLTLDTTIKLHVDSGETLFILPEAKGDMSLSQLSIGCYTVTFSLLLSSDEVRSNDTMSIALRVVDTTVTNNIVGVKGIEPVNNSTGPESTAPVPLKFRFLNPGKNDQTDVPITVTVVHQGKHIVHRDTVYKNFAGGDLHDISFEELLIPHYSGLGWYTVVASAQLQSDIRRSDDTLATRFARGFKRDSRTVSLTMPRDSAVLPEHTSFQPTVLFDCAGLDTLITKVPINIRIYNCQTNEVLYTASAVLPQLTLSGLNYAFPFTSNGVSTRDFPPGCYKIIAMTTDTLDNNYSNDQIYSRFYIGALSVDDEDDGPLQLAHAYPNPATDFATIGFTLAEPGNLSLRLIDMRGLSQQIILDKTFPSGSYSEQIDLRKLPDGVYLYELLFSGNNGSVKRIAKTLTVAH